MQRLMTPAACLCATAFSALAIASSGCVLDNDDPQVTEGSQDLYQSGASWPSGIVPVCYDPVLGNNPTLLAAARSILDTQGWSAVANVQFTGWGPCGLFAGPGGNVRVTFASGSNGNTSPLGYAGWNAFTNVQLVSDGTSQHFTYEVLHEFGHALGWAHEQQRPDNWAGNTEIDCTVNQAGQTTTSGTYDTSYFDTESIMSYCTGWPNALSPGDVAGVQRAYGKRTPIAAGENSSNNAVARTANNLDQFWVHADGSVWTSYWYAGMNQWPWPTFELPSSGPGTAPAGAPIATISRTPNDISIFYAGNDSAVHISEWTSAGGWSTGTLPGTAGLVTPGEQVAALTTTPGTLQVFFTGKDHDIYWSERSQQCPSAGPALCGWQTPDRIIWAAAAVGGAVSAVARTADNLDVFYISTDGRLHDAYCSGYSLAGTCRGTFTDILVGTDAACATTPGTGLAATARSSGNLDVFYASNANGMCTSYWYQATGWGTFPIGLAAPRGQVAAVTRTPDNLDLFFLGGNGNGADIMTAWWYTGAPSWAWADLGGTIGDVGVKGGAVGAAARTPNNLDVFARAVALFGGGETVTTAYWYTGAPTWSLYETNYY